MRELKFRAFDGERMRYDITGFEHGNDNRMTGVFIDGDYWKIADVAGIDQNEMHPLATVMQYTGLHDKDGKEIYEGDVVSITNPLCQIQKARLIGVVGFSWAAFHVEIRRTVEWELYNVDAPELMFLMNIANSKEIAVIGNINENPELVYP